ncbi:cytochrome c family protein [Neoehrlichia mikurensis]|uniref:Cytochrome c homolog n=1 Tax=Neoehrlichia mikurensis TaxID=89586 RepID=A0A9Q9F408_9RICK|nr:cytochrome c family protein [Neoehrlichia mikurensis]QXK91735.1 cytochrome c family protein [Neoehrlichia mikurensis]QXK92947.1 cytochrome c family protein [Neoehrlichia mikurensis]QXK93425.1 cytochrome c family protein [Neoehrlichia mikurensis]UTO55622.1 cytochrome c family protein [Neoehrlichia mikurensis]UTO56543.1 cytochrome c family protein [Neoehrlichia mikurensis]
MDGFNLNKIATAILFSSFLILVISNIVDLIYNPKNHKDDVKGYEVTTLSKNNTKQESPEKTIDIKTLIKNANAAKGKDISKKCVACHTFEKEGKNKVGPNLWHIIGNNKGHLKDFNYSKALLSKGGIWTEEELFTFLTKPQAYIKGTRMSFAGISNPQDIADLLAYFKSLE